MISEQWLVLPQYEGEICDNPGQERLEKRKYETELFADFSIN